VTKMRLIDVVYQNVQDAGTKRYIPKPQYVRDGYIFTCPYCGKTISSHSYINGRAWEDACIRHLNKHKNGEAIK